MKKFTFVLILAVFISSFSFGQVYQLPNPGFELWDGTGDNDEPTFWNGFPSGACDLSGLAALGCPTAKKFRHQISTDVRPGSDGSYSCKIFATAFGSIIANGNITTGQIRIGSTTATDPGNYNITRTGNPEFNQPFNAKPDSIRFWAKFQCPSETQQARMSVTIHDAYDYRDPSTSDTDAADHIVGKVEYNFTRGNQDWNQYTVPFSYDFPATNPEYMLLTFATNVLAGQGSINDFLFIDDIEMIYNVNLNNIAINGVNLAGFDPNVTIYRVDANCMPYGDIAVAGTAASGGNVVVTPATNDNPVATITVTKGDQTKQYRIEFFYQTREISADVCINEPYNENGFDIQGYSEAGQYSHSINEYTGDVCVVLNLTLNVRPEYYLRETHSICEGGSYLWHGVERTNADVYYANYESQFGCDSIYELTLTVNPITESTITVTSCGDYHAPDGVVYTESGIKTATIENMYGCDSVITINLTINPNPSPTVNDISDITVCSGEEVQAISLNGDIDGTNYEWVVIGEIGLGNGESETEIPSFVATSTNITTARVVVTPRFTYDGVTCEGQWKNFYITVNPVYNMPLNVSICQGEEYDFFGTILTEPDTYSHTLQTINGCDSIINLNLTVNNAPAQVNISKNPEDGKLFSGTSGEISVVSSESGSIYWVKLNDNAFPEVEGTGNDIILGSNLSAGIYEVMSRTQHNCVLSQGTVEFLDLSGIFTNSKSIEISIFPNPVENTINFENLPENVTLNIFDANGKLLINENKFNRTEINVSSLVSGNYIMIIITEKGETGIGKFIKK